MRERSLTRNLSVGLLLVLMVLATEGLAQPEASEYELKAAFIYNFASYVTWPEESFSTESSPLVYGIIGAPEMVRNLEVIAENRRVNGRPVRIRRLSEDDNVEGLHVLFVARDRLPAATPVLSQALEKSVLTVTESSSSDRSDLSVINFEVLDNKVRFDISLAAAQGAGLAISSRLLQIALHVIGPEP